jgi:hypothetical protein
MSQDKVEIVRGFYPPEGIEMVALVEDVQALKRNYGPILHPDFGVSADPEALTMVGVEGATASGMDGFIAVWRDWCNAVETDWVTRGNSLGCRMAACSSSTNTGHRPRPRGSR